MIIAFGHHAGSGKSTASDYISKHYNFKQIAFADNLKAACKIIFNFSDEQVYGKLKEIEDEYWGLSPREVMQIVATDLFRDQFDKDIWIKSTFRKINSDPKSDWVISDLRFINEAKYIKEQNGILIKLGRKTNKQIKNHKSEIDLDSYQDWDYVINNNGTLNEFHKQLDSLILKLKFT